MKRVSKANGTIHRKFKKKRSTVKLYQIIVIHFAFPSSICITLIMMYNSIDVNTLCKRHFHCCFIPLTEKSHRLGAGYDVTPEAYPLLNPI